MRARSGAVTGATADAVVAILVGRAPRPRPVPPIPRNRLAALASLAYPLWQPDPPDERGIRIVSLSATLLIQIVLILLLFFFMQARFFETTEPAQRGDEVVIQATFIGDGTPDAAGGGAPQEVIETSAPVAASAPSAATPVEPAPQTPVATSPVSEMVTTAAENPEASVAAQPLVVTQTRRPDTAFRLPPPRPAAVAPTVAVREREIPSPSLQAVEIIERRPEVAPSPLPSPTPADVQIDVRERAIVMDRVEEVARRPVEVPVLEAPAVQSSVPDVAITAREIPLRTPPAAATAAAAPSPADPAPRAAPSTAPAAVADDSRGTQPRVPAAGQGTQSAAPPGGSPSPRAGDDWGDAAQARDGGQPGSPSGLLDADGRPRLAGGGRVGGGLPPGTVTEDFEKIDRMGTWLKRPPTDYQPTSLERFWVPSETLLQEWVRRSVQTVLIPIPGTSKTIQCNVALLAFGGGCGITDPYMQDVESDGRPPPDVPWKPELQEDQESLGN